MIAEEVVTVYPELVTRGATGEVESVRYEALMPLLLNELQHQQRQVAGYVEGVGWLEAWGASLIEAMEALQALAAERAAEQAKREAEDPDNIS